MDRKVDEVTVKRKEQEEERGKKVTFLDFLLKMLLCVGFFLSLSSHS